MGDADLSLEITNTLIPNITQKIHADIIRLPRLKEVRRTASQVRHEHNPAPEAGLETTTLRLTAGCSAIELLGSR